MNPALQSFYQVWMNNLSSIMGPEGIMSLPYNTHLATTQISDNWISQETQALARTLQFFQDRAISDQGDTFTAAVHANDLRQGRGLWGHDRDYMAYTPQQTLDGLGNISQSISGSNYIFSGIPHLPVNDFGELSRMVREGFSLLPQLRERTIDRLVTSSPSHPDPQRTVDLAREERAVAKDFLQRTRDLRRYQENRRTLIGMRAGTSGGRGAGSSGGGSSGVDTSLTLNRPSLLGY